MKPKQTELKERIKKIAKAKKLSLKDIYNHLGISQVAFDKSFHSKNFEYSKRINDIAEFLGVNIDELVIKYQPPETTNNVANDNSEIYNKSICKNNFFPDEKTEIQVLRTENELLRKIIDKQESEIQFLRKQLMK